MTLVRPDIVRRLGRIEREHSPAPNPVRILIESYPGEPDDEIRIRHGLDLSAHIIVCRVQDCSKPAI